MLLFLLVGMLMGTDGVGYHFDNVYATQFVGIMALSVILFSGGMDTRISDVKPIVGEGLVLATFGVVATAALTGAFIWGICGLFGFKPGLGGVDAVGVGDVVHGLRLGFRSVARARA